MTKLGKILLVTGPAGAGKTTACRLLAETGEGTWAFVAQDDIRQFVKAGYMRGELDWTEETHRQWNVSTNILGKIAREYQAQGINCVIECFAPIGRYSQWVDAFHGVDYTLIILMTDVDTAIKRNAMRRGEARLRDDQIREFHGWFEGFHKISEAHFIDTTTSSPKTIAQSMLRLVSE